MLLAYPLALVMVRGHPLIGRALTVIVLAPLLINVVVRTYAWRVILANGENGVLNWTLAHVGLGPVQLLYTEWADHHRLGARVPADDGAAALGGARQDQSGGGGSRAHARRILVVGVPPRDAAAQRARPRGRLRRWCSR